MEILEIKSERRSKFFRRKWKPKIKESIKGVIFNSLTFKKRTNFSQKKKEKETDQTYNYQLTIHTSYMQMHTLVIN